MKKTLLRSVFMAVVAVTLFVSCQKQELSNQDQQDVKLPDYSSEIDQQRVAIGNQLSELLKVEHNLKSAILSSCAEKFDGDRDVLLNDLFCEQIQMTSTKQNVTITTIGALFNLGTKTNSDNILLSDTLLQVYHHLDCNSTDTTQIDGIVVVPTTYSEKTDNYVKLILPDGTQSEIRTDVDPVGNYLVISENERSGFAISGTQFEDDHIDLDGMGEGGANDPYDREYNPNTSYSSGPRSFGNVPDMQNMIVTSASFTSIQAKREVESWILGEPEVRLTVLGTAKSSFNVVQAMSEVYYYPHGWLDLGLFVNGVKWNNTTQRLFRWYKNQENWYRTLIFTEEDRRAGIETIKRSIIINDQLGSTELNFSVLLADNDAPIGETSVDYDFYEGEYSVGYLKFRLSR